MGRVRSPKRRVRDDDFVFGLSSDILESSFYWRKHFREFPLKSWASRFRGRRSIWWGWRVTLLAPRHWKWRFICDADQWWHSFCVAGAALRDILGDSRDAKCCILQYKIVSKMGRVRSPKRRVRDDDFVFGLSSDILESSFYWRKHFREFPLKSWASRFRGRRSIWWGWRVTWLAPRIGNDVSYAMRMKDAIHFAWQAQYLLSLKGDFTCSTQWKWRIRCDADEGCFSFCVAGGVFAEFEWWLYLLRAMEMTFHMCCCILS